MKIKSLTLLKCLLPVFWSPLIPFLPCSWFPNPMACFHVLKRCRAPLYFQLFAHAHLLWKILLTSLLLICPLNSICSSDLCLKTFSINYPPSRCWRRSLRGCDHRDDPWAGLRHSEAPHPLPIFGMCIPSSFPVLETAQGRSLEIVVWCWDHLDRIYDWTQLRSLYKLLRFGGHVRRSTHLAVIQDKPGK